MAGLRWFASVAMQLLMILCLVRRSSSQCRFGAVLVNGVNGSTCLCDQGNYGDAAACLPCPKGTYKSEVGTARCRDCPLFSDSEKASISPNNCSCITGYTKISGECFRCLAPDNCAKIVSTREKIGVCGNCSLYFQYNDSGLHVDVGAADYQETLGGEKFCYCTYLDLSNRYLAKLGPSVFSKMRFLERLDLFGNYLASISATAFSNLPYLKQLYLQGNKMRYLPPGLFNNLTSLEGVYLDQNSLIVLEPDVFSGLDNLKTIYLESNNLEEISSSQFQNLGQLQTLEISYNYMVNCLDLPNVTVFQTGCSSP
ncbi:hypothetical protein GUITHDRAFT_132464 [Guillardia theta CCMP2712]|uniref:Tyrosine-protein kinase ephrin type A/B receptor-like domain-containing protein n=1 Tax=Guillardia theta (strain CCMP2712) TaxID=905079 RepID=L1K0S1_GUITC|nr:hypothetical protein GUITHDRAFT_132464 [Guillardia theta CCMP2712]EKX54050.1 hypothetical protein GUITHDRAFT_132464 [Guillardia theta CCMP2712]|eukprot:XP_005841030.1 hypothetical protein GUITHDRAFT_132464 [Guillardia theta CCMP2712]